MNEHFQQCLCGSGRSAHVCQYCGLVCNLCHRDRVLRKIASINPERLSFPVYFELRRGIEHAREVSGRDLPELEAIKAKLELKRPELIERYGIDPDMDGADRLYNLATGHTYLYWLVRNSLTASSETALKFVQTPEVAEKVKGIPENKAVEALIHNLPHVFEKEYNLYLRMLGKSIRHHYARLILGEQDDDEFIHYENLSSLSKAVGREAPPLDELIRQFIPKTLSSLASQEGEAVVTLARKSWGLLNEADALYQQSGTIKNISIKRHLRSQAAQRTIEAASIVDDEFEKQVKNYFPEVSEHVIQFIKRRVYSLRITLSSYFEKLENKTKEDAEAVQTALDLFQNG